MRTKITADFIADTVEDIAKQAGAPVEGVLASIFLAKAPAMTAIFNKHVAHALDHAEALADLKAREKAARL